MPSSLASRCVATASALLLAFCAASAATADLPEGWFVWPAVEPADGTAVDVSTLNAEKGEGLPRIAVRDGRFVTADGQRRRFWATNVSANEAFPASPEEAAAIARRFAKAGINLVRLHHLDNPWGANNGGNIWLKGQPQHSELDPGQLDKLHRLVAALRDEGIYVNFNLKVSKQLGPEDGFDPSVGKIPHFQKRVDIFDRRMIDLQKDYARRLLTTKNPYTGFTPAEDPAVAVVEITNENSLLGYWTRDLGRGLEKLPAPFREDLRAQWNRWLAGRYADDAAIATAWAPPTDAARAETIIPGTASWQASIQPGSAATLAPSADKQVQELQIAKASGIDWHVQAVLRGVTLQDGVVYTVEFQAKADQPRKLGVGVGIDNLKRPLDPWRSFGLLETVELGADWQTVRLVFPAHSVAGASGALSLNAGHTTGTIAIKDLKLLPAVKAAGLQPGQSARDGSVPLPLAPTAKQWADWIQFLADTERAFADEMRSFLKEELKVQAPTIGSQIDYGGLTGLHREQAMDFADGHAYWQHPDFPADADWDPARYTIRNSPQLAEFKERSFGELGNLALVRVAGKPFTVSEYD
ncbi:MAG TPA: carbohydrate binding domain-containing protein, partial [Opitutus sp.]|nr:carbohydrate binding domain-containing protein [Opitutus sp.]